MNHQKFYKLRCVQCKKETAEEKTATVCPSCGGALDVEYDYEYIKSKMNFYSLRNAPISARKYLGFYPLNNLNLLVTLSEGGTPLRNAHKLGKKLGLKNLYIKNEGANPTGVFKDRGSLVELTKARELGAKAVCCASTGNMAASVSAYAAASNMPCYVLVPEGTPIGKLAQSLIYGARILQIRGTYADCCRLCEEMAKKHNFYLAGDYVFRAEGQKSCAYEIIEQLFWKVPDAVIVPMGCGTNISAIWKGFKDLKALGFIRKMPKMIGVQPEKVPTIVDAFRNNKKRYTRVDKPSSVASAVGIGEPLDDIKALRTLRESDGWAESAEEMEILQAEKDMAHEESIFVEPSAALPVACLKKLLKKKVIKENDVVVCIATGLGLKDPKSATAIMPDPPVLEPTNDDIDRYLKHKIYEIRAASVAGRENMLWTKIPTKEQLKKIVKKEFNLTLSKGHLEEAIRQVKLFHEKTEKMRQADLQYIVENVLKNFTDKKKVLEVKDYKLDVTRHEKPRAEVEVLYFGETIRVAAKGAGPVDAIIKAARKAIEGKDKLECWLTSYNVEISTQGTDAVVEVQMGVKSKDGTEVLVSATSPDIIVASIDCFEKGYNNLFYKSNGK